MVHQPLPTHCWTHPHPHAPTPQLGGSSVTTVLDVVKLVVEVPPSERSESLLTLLRLSWRTCGTIRGTGEGINGSASWTPGLVSRVELWRWLNHKQQKAGWAMVELGLNSWIFWPPTSYERVSSGHFPRLSLQNSWWFYSCHQLFRWAPFFTGWFIPSVLEIITVLGSCPGRACWTPRVGWLITDYYQSLPFINHKSFLTIHWWFFNPADFPAIHWGHFLVISLLFPSHFLVIHWIS